MSLEQAGKFYSKTNIFRLISNWVTRFVFGADTKINKEIFVLLPFIFYLQSEVELSAQSARTVVESIYDGNAGAQIRSEFRTSFGMKSFEGKLYAYEDDLIKLYRLESSECLKEVCATIITSKCDLKQTIYAFYGTKEFVILDKISVTNGSFYFIFDNKLSLIVSCSGIVFATTK